MNDCIFLQDYRKTIEIGAFQEERRVKQDIILSIEAYTKAPFHANDDEVDAVLSYDLLIDAIESNLAARRYDLLEKLAEDIAAFVLSTEGVASVKVKIKKPDRVDGALGVCISRTVADAKFHAIPAPSHRLYLLYNDHAKKLELEEPAVIVPMIRFEPIIDAIDQRILILELDKISWRYAKDFNLTVADTLTETQSLLTRKQSFIRAFGKAVFSAPFINSGVTEQALIDWVIEQISPTDVNILK